MIRLDLSYFYRLGLTLDGLRSIQTDVDIKEVWGTLYDAHEVIRGILNDTVIFSSMRGAIPLGSKLFSELAKLVARDFGNMFHQFEKSALVGHLNRFETVLTSELAVSDTYFVASKKPYNTLTLIAEGEALFPMDLPRKVPAAVHDLREVGKCIAFEIPTAAGFHLYRAIEAILRCYWDAVTGGAKRPDKASIGVYLAALDKEKKGDAKVIAALRQIKDLHRNGIIHPEESLSMDEALALVGIASSVSGAMLKELPFVDADIVPPDDQAFPNLSEDQSDKSSDQDA